MKEVSRPNIAICVPYYRHAEGGMLLSAMDLCYQGGNIANLLTIGSSGCYIEENRNGCVQFAINTGVEFDWLLWLDTDMIFPGNALERLLAHGKDIVGANYRQRTPPYKAAGVYKHGDPADMWSGLHEMAQIPTGLLLTRFDIYRKMQYPWFLEGDRTQARDDIYFCRRAVEMGYEIWCDNLLSSEVRHIDTQEIPWFGREQIRRVETGMHIDNVAAAEAAKDRAALSRDVFSRAAAE